MTETKGLRVAIVVLLLLSSPLLGVASAQEGGMDGDRTTNSTMSPGEAETVDTVQTSFGGITVNEVRWQDTTVEIDVTVTTSQTVGVLTKQEAERTAEAGQPTRYTTIDLTEGKQTIVVEDIERIEVIQISPSSGWVYYNLERPSDFFWGDWQGGAAEYATVGVFVLLGAVVGLIYKFRQKTLEMYLKGMRSLYGGGGNE